MERKEYIYLLHQLNRKDVSQRCRTFFFSLERQKERVKQKKKEKIKENNKKKINDYSLR